MATEDKIGKKLKAYCAACRGNRNCEVMGHHKESGDVEGAYSWITDWYLLVCCGCEHVFCQSVSTSSEDYYQNEYGETVYLEKIDSWPAKSKRDRPTWFEHDAIETDLKGIDRLESSLAELYGALDHDLRALAAIGVRTSFDIAAEILGIEPNQAFQKKLDEMVDKHLIKDSEREHLNVLVDAGNASAHRGWKPSLRQLNTLMDTLEGFIYDAIVLPEKKKVAAQEMAKVGAKVPPKPTKTKAKPSAKPNGKGGIADPSQI